VRILKVIDNIWQCTIYNEYPFMFLSLKKEMYRRIAEE
jgi:hypothetical protein